MTLFWRVSGLIAFAALGALLWHALAEDPGYVLVTLRGYSIETTLVVASALLLLLWLSLRGVLWLLRLPFRSWRRRARRIARERLADGLVALHQGYWVRAEKQLSRAASDPTLRAPALLAALRATQMHGDAERGAELRRRLTAAEQTIALALMDAETLLEQGRAAEAQQRLAAVAESSALPPRGLELQMRALTTLGRAHEALAYLPALRQSQMLKSAALDLFETQLIAAALRQTHDADELQQRWTALRRAQRSHADIVVAYVERAANLGLEDQAAAAIERALKKRWEESLARLYGHLPRGQRGSPLKAAEHWLKSQPNSPALLLALGRLCREEELWGKAENYLHRALAQGVGAEAWEEPGHAYTAQHDETRARQAYANALRVARGDAAAPIADRGLREIIQDAAVTEERSPMGVPRLPGPEH